MLENYITYLNFLSQKFDKFFESQKPYICCKKGCGKCCKNAQFPYSQIEFEYLMRGTLYLDIKTKEAIVNNIKTTLEAKKIFEGKKFLYDCPFLIDNVCAVYDYRGIVCRSFGLPTVGENGKIKAPFCCFQGLNYSNVLEVRRINPKNNPLFAIIFGSTKNKDEVVKILSLKTKDYVIN